MRCRVVAAVAAVCLFSVSPLDAGTIRHDRDAALYDNLAASAEFAAAGAIGGLSGVLISPYWVLTAGHCVDRNGNGSAADETPGSFSFTVGGVTRTGVALSVAPGWNGSINYGNDLGLIRLAEPITSVDPAMIYTGSSELNATITVVGYGLQGTGQTGPTNPAGRRAGMNTIDRYGTFSGGLNFLTTDGADRIGLWFDFDQPGVPSRSKWPSAFPIDLEYCITIGDSGAPAYLQVGDDWFVAGIASAVSDEDGSKTLGTYGDLALFTRVSKFQTYIEDTIANRWTNPLGGAFAAGGNWSDGTRFDVDYATFNLTASYAVAFANDAESRKLLVRQGAVTFELAGHTYSLTLPSGDTSLVVGRSSGDNAALTVSGGTLASGMTIVAAEPGSIGAITVSGVGAMLTVSESLYLGGTGGSGCAASVTVEAGAGLSVTGTLKLGASSRLTVNGSAAAGMLDNQGTVEVGPGQSPSFGSVVQRTGGALTGGTWIVNDGTLAVSGGAITTNQANVTLSGPNARFDKIDTLADNQGSFTVTDGRDFTTAGSLANSGTLSVGSGSTLLVAGGLTGSGTTIVGGGSETAALLASYIRQSQLVIGENGYVQIASSGGLSSSGTLGSLPIAALPSVESGLSLDGVGGSLSNGSDGLLLDSGLGNWPADDASSGSISLSAVPEPGSWAMLLTLALGVAVLGVRRRFLGA